MKSSLAHTAAVPRPPLVQAPSLAPSLALSLWTLALALFASSPVQGQSFCSSDKQARPPALQERFINADCETCWRELPHPGTVPKGQRGSLVLDWVLPGSKGEDAPLSSVARLDALARLEALRQAPPTTQWQRLEAVAGSQVSEKRRASAYRLRVAHGVAFNGYVGVSIELKPLPQQSPTRHDGPWTAWLALVESVPAGTEGSPVARQLVRNLLVVPWSRQQAGGLERRVMALPEGSNPERISLIGWVEDSRGRIQTAVQSACPAN